MNRNLLFVAVSFVLFPVLAHASFEAIKLPYGAGQSFVVVQGYDSPPTHINKDLYAIDFSQDGCDVYGKMVVAAQNGQVILAAESGYGGGYGTQVLVMNDSHIVTRYAHMIPGTIPVAVGDTVVQGEPLGDVGNTGLVAGAACPTHPGTHVHFAMYDETSDGSFTPYRPEPISGYVGITSGKWYLSDNDAEPQSQVIHEAQQVVATTTATTTFREPGSVSATPAPIIVSPPPSPPPPDPVLTSSTPPDDDDASSTSPVATTSTIAPASSTISITGQTFNSSTLAVDLSWQASTGTADSATNTVYQISYLGGNASGTVIATTTATNYSYVVSSTDFGSSLQFVIGIVGDDGDSTVAAASTTIVTIPNWSTVIQPFDDTDSNGSWYSDNWYDLGTGLYATIRSLTLEGFINGTDYFASHLYLDEYLDASYTQLNQTYTISNDAPFTDSLQKVTISGLNIPLQPNKYYRLRTYQSYQNKSVILAGTTATGTAMWNVYIYGVGRTNYQYSFYPYLAGVMIPNYPPLAPPNAPASMAIAFDSLNSAITLSWPAATDPDTTSSLLTYEVNVSPTSTLDDSAWRSVGSSLSTSTPVEFGNAYTVGVRAVDDLGDVGAPLTESWNFPANYAPVPEQLDHSFALVGGTGNSQSVTIIATTTVNGIALWTEGQFGAWCCSDSAVSIHPDADGTPGDQIAISENVRAGPSAGSGERLYVFDTPPTLSPGVYWFELDNMLGHNDTTVFGSDDNPYNDGNWSQAPREDAYFKIQQATGP